jgi:hypothetical protein
MIEPFAYSPGATPLDPDEAAGLLPGHIRTQAELNQWEETNILDAQDWLLRKAKGAPIAVLSHNAPRFTSCSPPHQHRARQQYRS